MSEAMQPQFVADLLATVGITASVPASMAPPGSSASAPPRSKASSRAAVRQVFDSGEAHEGTSVAELDMLMADKSMDVGGGRGRRATGSSSSPRGGGSSSSGPRSGGSSGSRRPPVRPRP